MQNFNRSKYSIIHAKYQLSDCYTIINKKEFIYSLFYIAMWKQIEMVMHLETMKKKTEETEGTDTPCILFFLFFFCEKMHTIIKI